MSAKNKARILAKETIGASARVDKFKGQLVVKRIVKDGRLTAWHERVKKQLRSVLPNWEVDSENKGIIILKEIKGEQIIKAN